MKIFHKRLKISAVSLGESNLQPPSDRDSRCWNPLLKSHQFVKKIKRSIKKESCLGRTKSGETCTPGYGALFKIFALYLHLLYPRHMFQCLNSTLKKTTVQ